MTDPRDPDYTPDPIECFQCGDKFHPEENCQLIDNEPNQYDFCSDDCLTVFVRKNPEDVGLLFANYIHHQKLQIQGHEAKLKEILKEAVKAFDYIPPEESVARECGNFKGSMQHIQRLAKDHLKL